MKNKQIDEFFGIDYATVSQGCKRLREHKVNNKNTRVLVEKIEQQLSRIKN